MLIFEKKEKGQKTWYVRLCVCVCIFECQVCVCMYVLMMCKRIQKKLFNFIQFSTHLDSSGASYAGRVRVLYRDDDVSFSLSAAREYVLAGGS